MATIDSGSRGLNLGVECPGCGYLLRGLSGPVVRCPECGHACDIPSLVTRHRRHWTSHAQYVRLAAPALLMEIGAIVAVVVMIPATFLIDVSIGTSAAMTVAGAFAVLLVGWWVLLLVRAARREPGRDTLWLIALLHVVLLGYTLGAVAACAGVALAVGVVIATMDQGFAASSMAGALLSLALSAAAVGVLTLLYRVDRYVGRRCVMRQLGGA